MKRPVIIHSILFLVVLGVWLLVVSESGAAPEITAVEPEAARPGDLIVIHGENFGDSRQRGRVRISGRDPRLQDYESWTDERISVRVPEDVSSGLVYVTTGSGRSNGALFRNRNTTPEVDEDSSLGLPVISTVSPERPAVGDILTIEGDHFGNIRGDSAVLFRRRRPEGARVLARHEEWITPADEGPAYVSWSDTLIRVRVPEGVAEGALRVRTDRGPSEERQIAIDRAAGTLRFTSPRNVALQHEIRVSLSDGAESPPERIYFWAPRLESSPSQRRVQQLTRQGLRPVLSAGPLELHRLTAPFGDQRSWRVRVTTLLDVYAVSTEVNTVRLRTRYDTEDAFVAEYLRTSPELPVGNQRIRSLGLQIGRIGGDPYKQARTLFDLLAATLRPVEEIGNIGALEGLDRGEGNSFTYAAVYAATLRANQIPARILAGQLLPDEVVGESSIVSASSGDSVSGGVRPEARRHYWSEFYLYGLGWVPVDVALGDGLYGAEGGASRYFAGHPADRVAYSRGVLDTRAIVPDSERIAVPEMYFLADHHEEVVGDPRSYDIRWRNVRFLGQY